MTLESTHLKLGVRFTPPDCVTPPEGWAVDGQSRAPTTQSNTRDKVLTTHAMGRSPIQSISEGKDTLYESMLGYRGIKRPTQGVSC
jgi:hypothetical protein